MNRARGWLRRRLLPLHQAAHRRLHDLNYFFLEITQRCNLACRHCGSDCTADASVPDLPADTILKVLDGVRRRHDPSKITVAITGGEPLLYPGFFELGRAITDQGFPWGLVTNGWAWSPETVESMRAAGMRTITVSLDGPEGAHDWLRRRKGSFERAASTLRMLATAPWIEKMDVVTCVHRRNLDRLDETRDLLVGLGVRHWRLFIVSPIGRAASDPDLRLDRGEFRRLMAWIIANRGRRDIVVSFSESGYLGTCDTRVRNAPYFCRAGINVAGIMVDGAILACPNIDRAFAQGNVREDDFCDVWETRYEVFRDRSWMRTGDCAGCSEWGLCKGNSFHLWDREKARPLICHHRDFDLTELPGQGSR